MLAVAVAGADAVSEPTVLLECAEGVATITLNRPDKLNAFNEAHARRACPERSIGSRPTLEIRALLLTGAGRGFWPART